MLEVKRKPASVNNSGAATAPARVHIDDTRVEPAATGRKPNAFQQLHADSTSTAKGTTEFQTKRPVITGEAHIKGTLIVDGLLSGQIASSSGLNLKQRSSASFVSSTGSSAHGA